MEEETDLIISTNSQELYVCSDYNTLSFTNSIINDTMMDGMDWKEVVGVYIEHSLLPKKLRNKIVHNK